MPAFLHPGVYVFETPSLTHNIQGVATSTAIFVGPCERGPLTPTLITSREDFGRLFGGYLRGINNGTAKTSRTLAYAMDAFFGNGGTETYVLRVPGTPNTRNKPLGWQPSPAIRPMAVLGGGTVNLTASSTGMWAVGVQATAGLTTYNAGLYAVILPSTDSVFPLTVTSSTRYRIVVLYTTPGSTTQTIVEDWDHLSTDPVDPSYVVDTLRRSLYLRWPDGVPAAVPSGFDLTVDNTHPVTPNRILNIANAGSHTNFQANASANEPGDAVAPITLSQNDFDILSLLDDITDAGLLVIPSVDSDTMVPDLYALGAEYVDNRPRKDLFFIGDLPRHKNEALATNNAQDLLLDFTAYHKTDFAGVYAPWIQVSDPVGLGQDPTIFVSPSAAVAGIYARTDADRGVWKAPAGVDATIAGARSLEFTFRDSQQDLLNPAGINALRSFPISGPVVWGARTTVPASEWRYISVRRMAIFLRLSIYNGVQFAVFEPNDQALWSALRLSIAAFMNGLFRQGAFAGLKAEDAFFVKCDHETTTPDDQAAGFVNVLVGFAPARPAEFVVVKLSQIAGSV
jgi:phage tail sheath protein FI